MRSIYFISTTLFFLSFTYVIQGQTNVYVPFPDSGAKWNGEFDYCIGCGQVNDPEYFYFGFYFRETHDTVINALTYHLINFANTWYDSQNLGPPFSEQTVGAIREDSLHRIYYRSFQDIDYSDGDGFYTSRLPNDSDILLYDFSLNVGDSTPTQMYGINGTYVVGIDSILIGSTYRKALNLEDSINVEGLYGYDTWVEGIGSIDRGLLGSTYYDIPAFEYGTNPPGLTCFSINNQVLYPQNQIESCDTIAASINTPTQKLSMQIFPNPASDELFLKFSQNFTPTTITIYNSIGQPVYLPFNVSINKSLNIENLPAGLYIIKATDNENILTDVFIKE